jgi:hypothetical protein
MKDVGKSGTEGETPVVETSATYFYDEIDICGLLIKRVLYSATGIMMNLFII